MIGIKIKLKLQTQTLAQIIHKFGENVSTLPEMSIILNLLLPSLKLALAVALK